MADLTRQQRIESAQLSGLALRYAGSRGDDDDPVAALHKITTDPAILGHAAAAFLVHTEQSSTDQHAPQALQYLRAAGADEGALAAEAERVRYRLSLPRGPGVA